MDVLTGNTCSNEDVCAAGILFAKRLLPFQAPRRLAMMPLPKQKQSRELARHGSQPDCRLERC